MLERLSGDPNDEAVRMFIESDAAWRNHHEALAEVTKRVHPAIVNRCVERTKPALRNGLEAVRARLVSEREAIEQADERSAANLGLQIEDVSSPVLGKITAVIGQCDLYLGSIDSETDLSKLNSKVEFCLA